MIYTDFTLRIVADGAGFRVLAESSSGQASSPLELPEECDALWEEETTWMPAGPRLRQITMEGGETAPRSARSAGEDLFRALFAGDVGRLFDRARGELNGTANRGLRLRLHLDPGDLRLRRLGHISWERLRCPVTGSFLALDRRTPVVRCLDALQTTHIPPIAPPLRVLIVAANPERTDGLELRDEWSRIAEALQRLDGVEAKLLEHATRKSLRQQVREEAYHVIHFMGHGEFDEATGNGSLYLETPDGQVDSFPGDSLAALFSGPDKPTLIVLNACNTARVTERPDLDPFAGVAAALLLEGVPSVLAMAQPVADESAVELAEELYRRIVLGDPLEAAVVEARLALRTSDTDPENWTIPIHFVRPSAPGLPIETAPTEKIPERPVATPLQVPMAPVFQTEIHAGHDIGNVSHYQGAQMWIENGKPVKT